TNSLEIANTASSSESKHQIFLLGGEFNASNRQTIGTMAAAQVRLFRAHSAVLTIGALDAQTGAMDFDIEEAQVARAMIAQSQSVTVLISSNKFNVLASFEGCQLSQIDRLITEAAPPKTLAEALKKAGVEVIIASGS
ncbi:MAG: DeoR/GlpR transcriptional regulator, partial [Methylococcales bacterium]|nr:DeoR/GlpR transcriptional regulator [Methylococcales bacterium]